MLKIVQRKKFTEQNRHAQPLKQKTRDVEQLLEAISSGRFQERERATAELFEIARNDVSRVRKYASHVEPEVRARIRMVIDLVELGLPLGTSRNRI